MAVCLSLWESSFAIQKDKQLDFLVSTADMDLNRDRAIEMGLTCAI